MFQRNNILSTHKGFIEDKFAWMKFLHHQKTQFLNLFAVFVRNFQLLYHLRQAKEFLASFDFGDEKVLRLSTFLVNGMTVVRSCTNKVEAVSMFET